MHKYFTHICSLLILVIFLTNPLTAKNTSIHGKVIDKITNIPIGNVNIYISNTSIGTTTDADGYFEIEDLPQGTFDIIFSHVSYYFKKERCLLKHLYNDIGIVTLSVKVHQLETIVVEAEQATLWKDRYELFVEDFVGKSKNAESTYIVDPYKIDFWESDGKLYASSLDPIEIVNRSLGYNIIYFLELFENASGYTKFSGSAVFNPISAYTVEDSIRWIKNRRQTYFGSFRHFLSELNSSFSKFIQFPDSINISNDNISDSIEIHRSFTSKTSSTVTYAYQVDSISSSADDYLNEKGFFLYRVFVLPWEEINTFPDEPISVRGLLSLGEVDNERYIKFSKYLRVYYIPNYNKEDYPYNFSIKKVRNVQSSFIHLEQDSVMIDVEGRYYDKFGIHTYGKFGNERIADMLPYEYRQN